MDEIRILTPQKSKAYSDESLTPYQKISNNQLEFSGFTPSPSKIQTSHSPIKIQNFRTEQNTYTRLPEVHKYESIKVPLKTKDPIVLPNQSTGLLEENLQSIFTPAPNQIRYFPDIKSTLLQFLTLCTVIFGVFVLSSIIWDIMNEQHFCSDTNEKDCLPCPQHGICSLKSMHCEPPFIKIENKCIENSKEIIKIHTIFSEFENYVSAQARLEYRTSRSCFKMTLNEYFYLFPKENYIKEKIEELLYKNESSVLEILKEKDIDFIKAKELKLKLQDFIIIFWQDYRVFFEILITMVILSIAFYKMRVSEEKVSINAKEVYMIICSQLKKNCDGTSSHGILESRLKNILIEKIEIKLFEKIWREVQELQKKDCELLSRKPISERDADYLWQWNDK